MTCVIEKTQALIDRYGTATQHALFFTYMALRDAVRDRYVVSEETLAYCRIGFMMSLELGQLDLIGHARMALGLCLLCSGHLDEAEEHLHTALVIGEQIGDVERIALCRGFLPFVFRLRGQVEGVREEVAQALAAREKHYSGVVIANSAWIAWRADDLDETERCGRFALEDWLSRPHVYPFQWTALWPLIGSALTQERQADAMDYVRMLLQPSQQRMPATLDVGLEAALQAWDAGGREDAQMLLRQVLPIARTMGYL